MKEIRQDQPVFAPLRLGAQDQMDVFGFFSCFRKKQEKHHRPIGRERLPGTESSQSATSLLSPQAIGSWLLLPATAEDNKKIHSILRTEA
jgi:hypothetical protein